MKTGLLVTAGVFAVAMAVFVTTEQESTPTSRDAQSRIQPTELWTGESGQRVESGALSPRDVATSLSRAQIARVDAYLELQGTREALRDYFDDPEGQADRATEVFDTINELERDGRVMGFEAMHLKLSWLALNTPDEAAYEAQAAALVEGYAARDRAAREAFKPENIPGFTDYKTREAEIIAEVNGMDSFPQGQTRQQYLRERLLEARIEAYGEGGEQVPPR